MENKMPLTPPNFKNGYTVFSISETRWIAVFILDGKIVARSPNEHADRTDAVQEVISICHSGVKDPRKMRKLPKWTNFEE